MLEKHLFSLFEIKTTCLGMTHCRSVWKIHTKKFLMHKKKKSVYFWVSAEALSAWCICLSKGTEKRAELLNMVVFIRGFQWSEPPQQLFTSLPISSKHIIHICYGRNLEVKFSSDSGESAGEWSICSFLCFPWKFWGQGRNGVPHFLHCLIKPYQGSEKQKSFKKYRTTECTSQEEGRLHLNLLGGLVPVLLTVSPASFAVTWGGETLSNN